MSRKVEQKLLNSQEKLGVALDVLRLEQDNLQKSQESLIQSQTLGHIGNFEWDIKGNKNTWSKELFSIVGYATDEFEPTFKKYYERLHPDDKECFQQLHQGVMKNRSTYTGEYRIIRLDGEIRNVLEKGKAVLDSEHNIVAIVGVIQDITERKEADRENLRMQKELQQAHKMESLGQLSGGVAHDFNNLLGIINGFAELVKDKLINQGESRLVEYVSNITDAGERAATLVAQMLSFSRGDQTEDITLQFAPLIKDEIKMLRATLPSTIEIKDYMP